MDQVTDKSAVTGDFTAESFLGRLGERGIEYVFANAGTDFAPIIEAVSRNSGGRKFPRFVTAPHENLAMGMANGYYRVSGKPGLGGSGATVIGPGVWPWSQKRAVRRASASLAFTG